MRSFRSGDCYTSHGNWHGRGSRADAPAAAVDLTRDHDDSYCSKIGGQSCRGPTIQPLGQVPSIEHRPLKSPVPAAQLACGPAPVAQHGTHATEAASTSRPARLAPLTISPARTRILGVGDPEAYPLRKEQLPEQGTQKGQSSDWMSRYLVSVLAAGLVLIFCLLVLGFMFANQSQDVSTTMNTLPPLNVPKASELNVTRPRRDPRSHGTTALPVTRHQVPSYPRPDSACGGCHCRSLGQSIRAKIDHSVDPCKDFYAYVCNTFRGYDEFTHAQDSIRLYTLLRLIVPLIPESNQLSWQKAAGMYHACLNFASSYKLETQYLVEWMRSLNLDLLNETRLATVNPVEMMVRGSLDLRY
ncbi:hypothetical protein MTO96_018753 [Rhipicephalus appendiculatus]